ncbi:hypothetical protein AX15_006492 [Amanita polypyramis BW_CC]|nr:hypothetical protein AX15_006492 [Amanita polypyramis BW_CC]
MVSSTPPVNDGTPPPISPGGTYSIQTVSVGCKIYIRRPGPDGGEEERSAEILSIRDKPTSSYARLSRDAKVKEEEPQKPEDQLEFFVHWDAFNKRLDEWVPGSRLVLSRDLEWPRPKNVGAKKNGTSKLPSKAPRAQSLLKRATSNAAQIASPTPIPSTPKLLSSSANLSVPGSEYALSIPPSPSPTPTSLKRKAPPDEEEEEEEEMVGPPGEDEDADADADADMDAEGEMDVDGEGEDETFDLSIRETIPDAPPVAAFSKEQEIEKLRTSGSMTQSISEITRVKNLNRLQIGKHEVDAWYFSPYPKEYAYLPVLYICEFCLSFFPSQMMLSRHRHRCTLLHPPGNEIYRHDDISFFEIDGKRQLTWCRNLSLLSKCFLDHKTLYYDVTPFMYYVMASIFLYQTSITRNRKYCRLNVIRPAVILLDTSRRRKSRQRIIMSHVSSRCHNINGTVMENCS